MTHPSPPIRLLAIDPGTRYLGLAAFEGTRLLDWRVRRATTPAHRQGAAPEKRIDAILRPLLARYQPQVLVIKRCSASQRGQSRMVTAIAERLHAAGHRAGLRVEVYTPAQVSQFFAPGRRLSRMELARIVATERYPFLAHWYERERQTPWYREHYYLRMFVAVALGSYGLHRVQPPADTMP